MSMDLTDVWAELKTGVSSVWTDLETGYTDSQGARKNWRDQLAEGKLATPFCVIRPMEPKPLTGRAIGLFGQRIGVEVTYIRSATPTAEEKAGKIDIAWTVENKCMALAKYFHDTIFESFLVPEDPIWDASSGIDANKLIYDSNAPYHAGSVYMEIEVHFIE